MVGLWAGRADDLWAVQRPRVIPTRGGRAGAALYGAKADGHNRVATAEAVPADRGGPALEPLVL